jgi:hypothetical protein
MRKQYLAVLSVASAVGLGLAGAGMASAHGFGMALAGNPEQYAERLAVQFTHDAQILGMSEADVKAAWADGKGIFEIAKEKGITDAELRDRMKSAREAALKTQLDTLVSKGVITREQADKRLAAMAKMGEAGEKRGFGPGHGRKVKVMKSVPAVDDVE